ncbi:acid sphingomyelinase-like phosphodiesterase 3b isoform X1 [Procambarus clarkii]|uniref:acid sphingomyelinase-like phosphodiesterase 3b isoform X1 n=1 Tax=Procambarus clarkii TaxID=6728 RepID=UPI003741FD38
MVMMKMVMVLLVVVVLGVVILPHQVQARIGTFWQVTDFHYDVNYTTTGSSSNMCWDKAKVDLGLGADGSLPGKFGDYECDAPLELVKSAINAMVERQPRPDFVLWTGDDTAHVSDQYFSTDKVVKIIKDLTAMLNQSFPHTPFYPVLGNHDYYPKNQFPVGTSELQTRVADMWRPWLKNDSYQSFKNGGRYWADVGGTNVTIVALNTLIWYKSNNNTGNYNDPDGQFAWADRLLKNLTARGRRVYLIGHIPPGTFERYQTTKEGFHWYYPLYNDKFIQMIQRHSGVIEAQFFAHHHTDSFRLFFRDQQPHDPGTPVAYQLLAPGVTPWRSSLSKETGANNPGLRLVYYDTNTGKIKEVSTYYLDLGKANAQGKAVWQLEYNFTSSYNLASITPASLYDLATKLKTNQVLFDRYYRANTVSLEDSSACSSDCRLIHWCAITEANYTRFSDCHTSGASSRRWSAPGTRGNILAWAVLLLVLSVCR